MPVGRSIAPSELAAFSSEIPGVEEKRRWCLYDTVDFAAAATVAGDINFFTIPIGGGAVPKTLVETNMRQAGQLPARQGFEIWDIEFQAEMTVVSEDATVAAYNNLWDTIRPLIYRGSLVFRQAQKVDLEIAPLGKLAAGWGIDGIATYGANVTAGAGVGSGAAIFNNGAPSRAALWDLDPLPIVILPQRSFQVTVNYPVGIVLPAGVALRLWIHLDGVLHRSA